MAKNSIDAYGARGKSNVLYFDPEDLVLILDPAHPLYDRRVHLPPDEPTVRNIMALGVLETILIHKDPETGDVIVVDGRRRVINAREANRRLHDLGKEPILVPALPKRADKGSLAGMMVAANEIRRRIRRSTAPRRCSGCRTSATMRKRSRSTSASIRKP